MSKCIYKTDKNLHSDIDRALQFRLDKIDKIKNYTVEENRDRKIISRSLNIYSAIFWCTNQTLLVF